MLKTISSIPALLGSLIVTLSLFATPASAVTVWTDWTSATTGAPGSAVGTLNGVTVSYTGEIDGAVTNGTSPVWAPDSSFVGGTVMTSPSTEGDIVFLNGNFAGVNTLAFASPLVDPVFAIWSLGSPSIAASFNFDAMPTLQAGGPNANFGGQSITVLGNAVSGQEGNGVVQFSGTFNSVSWTNTFENFYGFTVGVAGTSVSSVPEPGPVVLFAIGGAILLVLRHRTIMIKRKIPAV